MDEIETDARLDVMSGMLVVKDLDEILNEVIRRIGNFTTGKVYAFLDYMNSQNYDPLVGISWDVLDVWIDDFIQQQRRSLLV